jgi:FKBP-type peptidyl-prolyl cis-trans isomerase
LEFDRLPFLTMNIRCLLCVPALLLAGCFHNPLGIPPCTAGSFSQASVSADTITTTTGLRYIEGTVGNGLATGWCKAVSVHYIAYLLDGTKLESTHDTGIPVLFTPGVGALIDGFEQGVIAMHAGGTRRLIVPPGLGYGAQPVRDANGQVIVPANSTLVYDIEIVQVVP